METALESDHPCYLERFQSRGIGTSIGRGSETIKRGFYPYIMFFLAHISACLFGQRLESHHELLRDYAGSLYRLGLMSMKIARPPYEPYIDRPLWMCLTATRSLL